MKRYGREVDRLRALSGRLRSAAASAENGHSTTFPQTAKETLPDPPDDAPGVFGQDRGRRLHLRGRLDPGPRGGRVLLLFGLVAALVAVGYFWVARPAPQAVPTATVTPSLAPTTPAQGSTVVVHIRGKVRHPGIITLPSGSRVADAIRAAGGLRPGATTGPLNLARKLVDGEQIPVGIRAAPPPASGGPSGTSGPLDLNAATVDQLDQLPGVGPVLAQRIVDYRTQHGGFRSVDELQQVSGIGSRRYNDLKSMVRV